jgi:plastocyanin
MWFFREFGSRQARSPKLRIFLFLLVAIALAQLRCGENPLQPEVRGPNEVWIQSFGFDPATLKVSAGTTVKWTNKDNATHSVDSGTPTNPEPSFNSPNLKPNDTFPLTFSQRDTFRYYCLIHQNNHGTGTIIVQ